MDKKTTLISLKRALIGSLILLIISFSMFIGTTYAWFTDSVTSAGNKIQSGTLKIDLSLYSKDTGKYESIKESNAPIFSYDKWEPGYTDVKLLEIENEGTLAIKWIAKFISNHNLSDISKIIDVYVLTSSSPLSEMPSNRESLESEGYVKIGTVKEFVNSTDETTTGNLVAGDKAYIGIALCMRDNAHNKYQGMDLGGDFDIKVLAAQYGAESDSFGNNYDKNAMFDGFVNTTEALLELLKNSPEKDITVVDSIDGNSLVNPWEEEGENFTAECVWNSKNSTLTGGEIITNEKATFGFVVMNKAEEEGETVINNTAFKGNSQSVLYIQATSDFGEGEGGVVLNNVSVKALGGSGIYGEFADNEIIINDCKVDQNGLGDGYKAHFETAVAAAQGTKITINGGSYKSSRYALYCFGSKKSTIVVNGGTFIGEIKCSGNDEIIINGGTFSVDPSDYVADGTQVINNGNGTFTVES